MIETKEYIETRLKSQIEWYDKASNTSKWLYYTLKVLTIIISTSIPFLTSFPDNKYMLLIGFFGVLITIFTAFGDLFGFYKKWILYRSTCERLRAELGMFEAIENTLDDTEKIAFIERCESVISNENKAWIETINSTTNSLKKKS